MTGSLWLEIDGIVLEVLEKRDVLEESNFLAHGNDDLYEGEICRGKELGMVSPPPLV